MRLDDPELEPGETEEMRQKRLIRAAKLQKSIVYYRALAKRSSLAGRVIRLLSIFAVGLFLLVKGISGLFHPVRLTTESAASQSYGPYEAPLLLLAIGILVCLGTGYFIREAVRQVRSGNYPLPKA